MVTGGLFLTSLHEYILFHSLIEVTTIATSFSLLMLTWNADRYIANGYLRTLGVGYGCVAIVDLLHTLAYKGMNVFPGYGANLPTQLWIGARYLQTLMLLAAPFLIGRRPSLGGIFVISAAFVAGLVVWIFSGHFPACFVEGHGLTRFKIASEYVITALLVAAAIPLYRRRGHFDRDVFVLIICSIACTAISEISFTAYVSVYGFANMVGHYAKLAAFYLLYRAILVTGIRRPFAVIFRDLKQTEAALLKSEEELEDKVRARTSELRATENRYRSLIQKVQTAIVVHDAHGGIVACNPMAEKMLGQAQLMGKALADSGWCFVREDGSVLPVEEYPAAQVLATRAPLRQFVAGIRASDRSATTWALVNAEPEYDDYGAVERVIVSFVDITERKRSNEELEDRVAARTAQLEAANKELEAFAYTVSHDLRAPLRHIHGFVSLLQDKTKPRTAEQSRHYMDMIAASARRMGTLIDDLLSFSRMARIETKQVAVDLGELVAEVVRDLESETHGRTVVWRISSLPVITGDQSMLRLVWTNLLSNAVKFTRPRPRAEIEIGYQPDQERSAVFYVRDNGVGFDMRYVDKLFGVFQRLHRQDEFEGTGIGLATVRRVIGRHGGRTWAEGRKDGGATFYFSLPASAVLSFTKPTVSPRT